MADINNYMIVLFFIILPTCRLQKFLCIENRTIISRDTTSFVEEGQVLHNCYKNKHSKYVCLLELLSRFSRLSTHLFSCLSTQFQGKMVRKPDKNQPKHGHFALYFCHVYKYTSQISSLINNIHAFRLFIVACFNT